MNREKSVIGIAAAAALCVMGAVSHRPGAKQVNAGALATSTNSSTATPVIDPKVAAEDLKLQKQLIGRWRAAYHGVLTVENREDGTASMRMDFDFLASFLYGNRLDLQLTWKVENRILTYLILSGSPEENWKPFNKEFGDKVTYNFREVGENRIRLTRVIAPDEIIDWIRTGGPQAEKAND